MNPAVGLPGYGAAHRVGDAQAEGSILLAVPGQGQDAAAMVFGKLNYISNPCILHRRLYSTVTNYCFCVWHAFDIWLMVAVVVNRLSCKLWVVDLLYGNSVGPVLIFIFVYIGFASWFLLPVGVNAYFRLLVPVS